MTSGTKVQCPVLLLGVVVLLLLTTTTTATAAAAASASLHRKMATVLPLRRGLGVKTPQPMSPSTTPDGIGWRRPPRSSGDVLPLTPRPAA
ncbi:hypothetical protein ABFX02_07G047000 [Erythranthe guttata]